MVGGATLGSEPPSCHASGRRVVLAWSSTMPGARGEKLLTASDLAALCEVDLKTIHNWVDRGRIPHFRTPGRHLRFRAADVAEFLRTWGYSVPRELARLGTRSVLVIGSKATLAQAGRVAGGG